MYKCFIYLLYERIAYSQNASLRSISYSKKTKKKTPR